MIDQINSEKNEAPLVPSHSAIAERPTSPVKQQATKTSGSGIGIAYYLRYSYIAHVSNLQQGEVLNLECPKPSPT